MVRKTWANGGLHRIGIRGEKWKKPHWFHKLPMDIRHTTQPTIIYTLR